MGDRPTAVDRFEAARAEEALCEGRRVGPALHQMHNPATVDVRAIRGKLKLSQSEFAVRFGSPIDTLRKWE